VSWVHRLPTFRFIFRLLFSWQLLRWAAFAASIVYAVSITRAEYWFLKSFQGPSVDEVLEAAYAGEHAYPFDYRFRNRPLRTAIELVQHKVIPVNNLTPAVLEAIRTDPMDLEVIYNVGVWQAELGSKDNAKKILDFASRLAPGNPLIAKAASSLH
jgi:hypothetical protein